MHRKLLTIVLTFFIVIVSQSLSMGQLTPLTASGARETQRAEVDEKKTVPQVLLASHQPVSETIYTSEEITENNLHQDSPGCDGTLFGSRWCDNNNGTVTDLRTGLTWLKNASWGSTYPYWSDSIEGTNAFERAAQVEAGNPEVLNDNSVRGDWRLPTVSELKALTSGPEAVSAFNSQAFVDVQPDWYWSATNYETGSDSALNVGMHFGDVSNSNKRFSYHVWPVRSGNE